MMAKRPVSIRDLVVRRRDACVKFVEGQPARDRREAMQFYRGDNLAAYGDSGDGMSTVVSRDVMEVIESMMPPLVRPFVAGEQTVVFDPVEAGDELPCKQATDFVNHVFGRDNNVLKVAQTSLKDGLLFRLGIAKTVIEEEVDGTPEAYEGLTTEELAALEASGRELAGDIVQDEATGLYSATVAASRTVRFRVHIVAPDEFLYEERLSDLASATFLGHRKRISVADLIDAGIDEKKAFAIASGKPSEENDERFAQADDATAELAQDDPARMVWVDECYIKADLGAGMEWRKVLLGGAGSDLLSDEPAEDHPYSTWTPIPMPHKLVGMSMFDITRDVQVQKTALVREQLNNLYLVNRPQRTVIEGQANIDDLLQPAVNGIVRVKSHDAVQPLTTPFVAAQTFTMIEYLDGVREARTGTTRYNQGMDAASLNKTATGMNIISSNSQQRQELVARQFGEFLKDIFEKLLGLVSRHASPEQVERLTGQFVPWPERWDANVSVGLGNNNKDQLVAHLMTLMQIDEKIIQLQGGAQGPLVTMENIFEKAKRLVEAMGLKGNAYYTDPADAPMPAQQPQQDPLAGERMKQETEIGKAQIKADTDLQIAQMKQATVVPFMGGPNV